MPRNLQTNKTETDDWCLWINSDTGNIDIFKEKHLPNRIPFGYYVPHQRGSKKEMTRLRKKIMKARTRGKTPSF